MTSEQKITYEYNYLINLILKECNEEPLSIELIDEKLDELCDLDYLVCNGERDGRYLIFSVRPGLMWRDINKLACPIKKNIMLCFVNKQWGIEAKSNQIIEWTQNNMRHGNTLVVPIIFVENNRMLAKHSEQSLASVPNKYVYQFSRNASHKVTEIIMHIDLMYYRAAGYTTPVIISLPNAQQLKKVVSIMEHIVQCNREKGWNIKYGIIIDEFNKVYPHIRPKLLPFVARTEILHCMYLISASDINIDDYPECANAFFESHQEYLSDNVKFQSHESESSNWSYYMTVDIHELIVLSLILLSILTITFMYFGGECD